MKSSISFVFLLVSLLLFGQQRSPLTALANSTKETILCDSGSLPEGIQNRLRGEFSAWKIQEPADLGPNAHGRWESEKPLFCPGIAIGHFQDTNAISYAVLLVPRARPGGDYKLLMFSANARQSSYGMRVVEQSKEPGARNFFIHEVAISKFFDETWRKKFQVQASQGILLVDCGGNEYEADIYFWVGGRYEMQPVDY